MTNYLKLSFEEALIELEEKYKNAGSDMEEMISTYELRKMALEECERQLEFEEEEDEDNG